MTDEERFILWDILITHGFIAPYSALGSSLIAPYSALKGLLCLLYCVAAGAPIVGATKRPSEFPVSDQRRRALRSSQTESYLIDIKEAL